MKYLGKFVAKYPAAWDGIEIGKVYSIYEYTKEEIEFGIEYYGWNPKTRKEGAITTKLRSKTNDGIFKTAMQGCFNISIEDLIKKAKEIRRLGDKILKTY